MRNYINFYINLIFLTNFNYINSRLFRDPFSFSDLDYNKIKIDKLSKLNLNSKIFIVLNKKDGFKILKDQDYLFGYKISNLSKYYIILEDDSDNKITLIL